MQAEFQATHQEIQRLEEQQKAGQDVAQLLQEKLALKQAMVSALTTYRLVRPSPSPRPPLPFPLAQRAAGSAP